MPGINTQFGIADETTYGTFVAPAVWLPILGESLVANRQRLMSSAITAGKRIQTSALANRGDTDASGSVDTELYTENMGKLFKHALGDVTTTGAGPYQHVIIPGALPTGLSVQKGIEDVGGTVRAFSYSGGVVNGFTVAASAGSLATASFDFLFEDESTGESLGAPSYTSDIAPFSYIEGTTSTIEGADVCVRSFTLSGSNNLIDDRRCLGSANRKKPLEGGLREYTFEAELEFEDLTEYNLVVNDTLSTLQLIFTNGTEIFQIDAEVRWDGDTPVHADMPVQNLTGAIYDDGTTSLKLTITNNQATI